MINKLLGFAAAIGVFFVAQASSAPSPVPDVQVGDSWKFSTLDGFTHETQFESLHRVVDVNDREIVIELRNLTKDKTALRYFTR